MEQREDNPGAADSTRKIPPPEEPGPTTETLIFCGCSIVALAVVAAWVLSFIQAMNSSGH